MQRSNRGFTLIEVLVVVSILGVLAGLISILVVKSKEKQQVFLTDEIVKTQLPTAINVFKNELHGLPPMTVAELAGFKAWNGLMVAGNTTNECSECLLVALRHPDLSARLEELPCPMGNTDEDIWNKVPDGSDSEQAKEICDAWGNPIAYIHKNAYSQTVKIRKANGEDVEVHAVKKPNGTFYNPDSFQIISLGKNEVQDEDPGSSDDRENFTREEQ